MNATALWAWFRSNKSTLSTLDSTVEIVDRIDRAVSRLDERIGVEVSEKDSHGVREVIFSANGHSELFSKIEDLVNSSPEFLGWRFLALKPARGFKFAYRQLGNSLLPSEWSFLPLRDENNKLGLRIFIPGKSVKISVGVLRRILETGIGEKALSQVHYVEYVQNPDALEMDRWLGLDRLSDFIQWEEKRG